MNRPTYPTPVKIAAKPLHDALRFQTVLTIETVEAALHEHVYKVWERQGTFGCPDPYRAGIYIRIDTERERQDDLHGHKSIASLSVKDTFRFAVLVEEVGEVGTAMQTGDMDNLKSELTQVAACCVGWLETLP